MLKNERALAFQTTVDETSEDWRKFAHQLYNLRLDPKVIHELPKSIKFVLSLLKLAGNVKGSRVTSKGRFFVHDLTKTVVESLPFPVNNPSAIVNYEEYEELLISAQALLPKKEQTGEPVSSPLPQSMTL